MRHTFDQTPEHVKRIEDHRARIQAELVNQPNESTNESQERREVRLAKTWTYYLQRKAKGIRVA